MTFATILTAAIGYALIYAAAPSRNALREGSRTSIVRLLVAGTATLLLSASLGAIAVGPVIGPLVTVAAALAVGSVLVLIVPLAAKAPGDRRVGPVFREALSSGTRVLGEATEGKRSRS